MTNPEELTTFTPLMWMSMTEEQRYEEYVRVRNMVMNTPTPDLLDELEAELKRIAAINTLEDRERVVPELTVFMWLQKARAATTKPGRTCSFGACGKPDVNAPDEGAWPTHSRYPPACVDHLPMVPPQQRRSGVTFSTDLKSSDVTITSTVDNPTALRMCDVHVGMRLRDPRTPFFPLMTVTRITERGFSYELDTPYPSRRGVTTGGEHYGLDGVCLYEHVASPSVEVELERLQRIAAACGREADRWATKYRELKASLASSPASEKK